MHRSDRSSNRIHLIRFMANDALYAALKPYCGATPLRFDYNLSQHRSLCCVNSMFYWDVRRSTETWHRYHYYFDNSDCEQSLHDVVTNFPGFVLRQTRKVSSIKSTVNYSILFQFLVNGCGSEQRVEGMLIHLDMFSFTAAVCLSNRK